MVKALPDILATIVEQKKLELDVREPDIEERAERSIAQRRDFLAALTSRQPAVIAEIKKASPSKGVLAAEFDPVAIAHLYEQGGAAALSVLTDEKHFQGSLSDLESARAAVQVPVLRKDFTIDPYHVHQAAAHGADAILLIAAILSERQMRDFRELAERYQMTALVEVHDEDELKPAIASGARVIGVNNRNLHTFKVKLETSLRLAGKIPSGVVRVAESGIHSRADVDQLRAAGYHAFLVGEHLMKSGDPVGALQALLA
jgi:indole-3-glycerol phosphate synthase